MGIPQEFAAGEKPSSAAGLATRARSKPVGYFKPGVLDLGSNRSTAALRSKPEGLSTPAHRSPLNFDP
jgi:hypothetical protein